MTDEEKAEGARKLMEIRAEIEQVSALRRQLEDKITLLKSDAAQAGLQSLGLRVGDRIMFTRWVGRRARKVEVMVTGAVTYARGTPRVEGVLVKKDGTPGMKPAGWIGDDWVKK